MLRMLQFFFSWKYFHTLTEHGSKFCCLRMSFWGEARFAATRCQQGYLNYYFMIASWRFYNFSWETFSFFHHQHFPVSWRLERLIKISHLRELLMIPCCAWARAPRWQWTLHGHRSMSFHVVPCRSVGIWWVSSGTCCHPAWRLGQSSKLYIGTS